MENEEIDLKEVINLFWEKRAIILVALIISIVLGCVYTMYLKEPKYTSSVTLLLAQKDASGDGSKAVTQTDVTLNDKLIATYKELAKSNSVVREVINNLNINMTEGKLKSEINVTAVKDTQILKISVTDLQAVQAQKIANELSQVFVKKTADLYKIDNINIVDEAEIPSGPSNVNHKKDLLIFMAGGVVVAIIVILLINVLDTTVKSAADVEKSVDLMILAEVPECNFDGKKIV
ncbi:MAG: hypothetical protein IKG56_05315 [Clostridia bacterium]|nr:hypothetical protein [Clostridia bacterium]